LLAITRVADDLDVRNFLQRKPDAPQGERLIVS
jgi:hypothetical protein